MLGMVMATRVNAPRIIFGMRIEMGKSIFS